MYVWLNERDVEGAEAGKRCEPSFKWHDETFSRISVWLVNNRFYLIHYIYHLDRVACHTTSFFIILLFKLCSRLWLQDWLIVVVVITDMNCLDNFSLGVA